MCWRTYILFFQMTQTFGAGLCTMTSIQFQLLLAWILYYICTIFQFSASPRLRVIVSHYKKEKRGGGILSSLLISEFWSKSLSLPLSLSLSFISPSLYYGLWNACWPGCSGSVSNYELDAISLELSEESYSTNTQNGVGRYNSREYTYQTLSKKLV